MPRGVYIRKPRPKKARKNCVVPACHRPARSHSTEHCEAHYYRIRRNGTLALKMAQLPFCGPPVRPKTYLDGYGYKVLYAPWHVLTQGKQSKALREHRAVMFRHSEYGPYQCYWCSAALVWDEMDIDHLDDDRQNNDIANLAAACPECNVSRANHKTAALNRRNAPQISFDGKTMCLSEWAAEVGLSRSSLKWRLDRGWPIDKALTTVRGKYGPKAAPP